MKKLSIIFFLAALLAFVCGIGWRNVWECISQLPPTASLLWPSWRYMSINKRDLVLWDLSAMIAFWGVWREQIIESLVTRSEHLIKHSMFALLSFLTCSIFFQLDPGRWRRKLWRTHKWVRSPTTTPRRYRKGETTITQTICDQWHFGALIDFQI